MRYLVLRRLIQCGILALFAANTWILKGNLSASKLFDTIPLSDPFAALQIFVASLHVEASALLGVLVVSSIYGLFLGRAFCAWVCPVNMIVDFAAWFRRKLEFRGVHLGLPKNLRYILLVLSLILSFVLATPAFESVSFIGVIQRGIILGTASWIIVALLLFCVDAFLGDQIICSKLCPLGAFYSLVGRYALLKVQHNALRCTKCDLCFEICPERQVLWMVGLKSVSVNSGECTRCGRCIEVCADDALEFSILDLKGSFKANKL
ncbi:quinol dehydrogenase ferredoxin subunit NapH [Helicobacter bizzozeronii]|uniref:quinol dehydrogenase ferredoxin subunit NapH n=1 Tax=Helicobacter bizzozeronii TaxID=56877 RepID=UPI000CF1ADB7|nr:quinol dehydrogenase ferredoxin subunit NapH [Helicobacter bizzozeronii]